MSVEKRAFTIDNTNSAGRLGRRRALCLVRCRFRFHADDSSESLTTVLHADQHCRLRLVAGFAPEDRRRKGRALAGGGTGRGLTCDLWSWEGFLRSVAALLIGDGNNTPIVRLACLLHKRWVDFC